MAEEAAQLSAPLTASRRAARLIVRLALAATAFGLVMGPYIAARGWPWEEEARRATRVESLRKEKRALDVVMARPEEFEREQALLETKQATLDWIIPREAGVAKLSESLAVVARKSRARIVAVRPGRETAHEGYVEVPIEVVARGPWTAVSRFTQALPRLSRLLALGTVTFDAIGGEDFEVSVKATAYRTDAGQAAVTR